MHDQLVGRIELVIQELSWYELMVLWSYHTLPDQKPELERLMTVIRPIQRKYLVIDWDIKHYIVDHNILPARP